MIPILVFKDTSSLTHFDAIIIREQGSDVAWGTLYQKTFGSNWILEYRLSSTKSEVVNMDTTEKWRARLYTRELIWDLTERGLLNPPPQPSLRAGGSQQIDHRPTPPPPDHLDKHDSGIVASQPPAVHHCAHTAEDEHVPAVATQLPVPLLRRVLRAILPERQP